MRILWSRVVAVGLAIVASFVLLQNWEAIVSFIKSIGNIHPCANPQEQTAGLLAFGLIAIFILALVRILTQEPRK